MPLITDSIWAAVTAHPDTELDAPCSVEAIAAFENQSGIRLPPGYKEFLRRGNGGAVGYVRLCGIDRQDTFDLSRTVLAMRDWIQTQADGPIFPFASSWGGSYFCFDLRTESSPGEYRILYWEHEYSEQPEDRALLWSPFAADFVGFVTRVVE